MGTQSYRPWGERLLSKHKLFLSQEGPAFSIATPSQILFSLFKSSKGYRGYMFGVQRPWPVVYWWLACLGRSAGQSSNHNFIIFTPPFDVNGRKFQNQPKVFGRHCFAVGKLNSLFCTCIFIMSTEELEAFSYHQHSFLTEAGKQAT